LLNDPETGKKIEPVIRRRRTRRHRRNRQIRRVLLIVFCVGLAIGFAFVAPQLLSRFHASRSAGPDRRAVEASRDLLLRTEQESLRQMEGRPVYPYSVVPGGVRDASELKWAAEHDPVVASHYAGFDYDHARVVRLVLARTAYVSYRIGNKVYWTRHRVKLHKGETVITDGKITARTRCANRVEEAPQVKSSSSEPPDLKFDEPTHPILGTAVANPPGQFQSALIDRPGVPGLGPAPPLSLYEPLGGGTMVPLSPPPLPSVCGVGKKPTGTSTPDLATPDKKRKADPCGSGGGGGEVPEPATWLLLASGLAATYWKARLKFART
jgi:hypothetical protein